MRRAFLATTTLAVTALFAGCGGDDSGGASGPASVMPSDAPFYVEATVRPEGEQAENLDALLSELGELALVGEVGDPGQLLIEQIESQAAAAGVEFSYADDIKPWLGERAGLTAIPSETGEDAVIIAIETTDEDQARESIEGLLEQTPVEYSEEEYEGVSYLSAPDEEVSFGVFSGHVVFATPAEFEAAVDASEEESLAENDKLAETLASLGDESLASLYFDFAQFESFASTSEDAEEFEQAQEVAPEIFEGSFLLSAGVSASDQVYIDQAFPLLEGQPESGESALLGTAPGDSLGAVALSEVGEFGPFFADFFERARDAGADLDDFPEEGLAQAFEDETGIPFDDASAAIGDASLWARGELPDGIEVAGEIEASDPEVAAELIEAAEAKAREEGDAKIGPPVGGSDVGFSALETETADLPGTGAEDPLGGAGFDPESGDFEIGVTSDPGKSDLPFVNIELDGDVIRYGFFRDEEAAQASDPDSSGDFSETEAYAAGQEALGDDFEYLGAVDLAPILDEFVGGASITDALGGASAEALIGGFLADKLGVVALGQRYEDGLSIQRYVLKLAE